MRRVEKAVVAQCHVFASRLCTDYRGIYTKVVFWGGLRRKGSEDGCKQYGADGYVRNGTCIPYSRVTAVLWRFGALWGLCVFSFFFVFPFFFVFLFFFEGHLLWPGTCIRTMDFIVVFCWSTCGPAGSHCREALAVVLVASPF